MLVNVTACGASPSADEKVKLAIGPTGSSTSPLFSSLLSLSDWDEVVEPPEHEMTNKNINDKWKCFFKKKIVSPPAFNYLNLIIML